MWMLTLLALLIITVSSDYIIRVGRDRVNLLVLYLLATIPAIIYEVYAHGS